jgi:hypothetical protein
MPIAKTEREFHRSTGSRCFNAAWELLDNRDRDEAGDRRMLTLSHTARYHWGEVGGPKEIAIADWQLARAYADVALPALAIQYGEACLAACQQHGLTEILCTAYEGIARAHGVAGQTRIAREYLQRARAALDAAHLDAEDRKVYLGQIRDTESKIG